MSKYFMLNPENSQYLSNSERFQAEPIDINPDRAPKKVVSQTESILTLAEEGIVSTELRQNYLSTYTLPFLRTAAQGAGRVFDRGLTTANYQSLETNEAADFTNIVFGWMHYFVKSNLLPMGFSRKGMLKAPENSEEFVGRLKEIKYQLALIVSGSRETGVILDPAGFRTYNFFKVGSIMPLKFMESDREREEHQEHIARKLLEGIDTTL